MLEQASEELKDSICESYNTNRKQLHQDVESLREWIKTQPHLPQCSSDTMLATYLIACKNRMERAKEKIENYYTVRNQMPDWFADRDPMDERIQECCKELRLFMMPKLTPDGCRIGISSFITGDPKKYDMWAYSKRVMMVEDIKMNQDPFNRGLYFIFDSNRFTMSHVLKVTPNLARKLIYCAQDVLPIKIKGIIFINAPSYIDLVMRIIKPIIKSKLIQRFHIHTEGPEVLEKYFPLSLLPKDYGGDEDSSDNLNAAWMKRMEENRDWLLGDGSLGADENKRNKYNPPSKHCKDIQNMEGSFKTLCVD